MRPLLGDPWQAARAGFGTLARWDLEIPFLLCFGLNSSLKFENSYPSVESSKNHETSFVSFLISRSTDQNYWTE
jgi:hypothetical protein